MKLKTDNHDPTAKLELRRYFLRRYHKATPPSVLDCCQGGGLLWNQLRSEFKIANYWGIDLKPKKGRLKLDSVRVLAQAGWPQNVIDIDTYGSPWKHWNAMLPNVSKPITVFLTMGQLTTGTVGSLGYAPLEYMGLGRLAKKLPAGFHVKLRGMCLPYALRYAVDRGLTLVEVVEAASTGNARYVGLRLEPVKVARAVTSGGRRRTSRRGGSAR